MSGLTRRRGLLRWRGFWLYSCAETHPLLHRVSMYHSFQNALNTPDAASKPISYTFESSFIYTCSLAINAAFRSTPARFGGSYTGLGPKPTGRVDDEEGARVQTRWKGGKQGKGKKAEEKMTRRAVLDLTKGDV